MLGPLEQLLAAIQRQQENAYVMDPTARPRPHGGLLEEESAFAPLKGIGPRSFRDPEQAGPAPPVQGPLAQMTKGRY